VLLGITTSVFAIVFLLQLDTVESRDCSLSISLFYQTSLSYLFSLNLLCIVPTHYESLLNYISTLGNNFQLNKVVLMFCTS
jgi:hypothetical protein